jgi:hypothetical protein
VRIRNVFARGQGSSVINGHPDSWLENVTFDTVRLAVSHDPAAPYDKALHALSFDMVRNLKLRDVEVVWEGPAYERWRSAAAFDRIDSLVLERFSGRAAQSGPAVLFNRVKDVSIRDCSPSIESLAGSPPAPVVKNNP